MELSEPQSKETSSSSTELDSSLPLYPCCSKSSVVPVLLVRDLLIVLWRSLYIISAEELLPTGSVYTLPINSTIQITFNTSQVFQHGGPVSKLQALSPICPLLTGILASIPSSRCMFNKIGIFVLELITL
jgi:hypothetical protein